MINIKTPFGKFSAISLFFGSFLLIAGFLSGSKPMITADTSKYKSEIIKNAITPKEALKIIEYQQRSKRIVGFLPKDFISNKMNIRSYDDKGNCFDVEILNDLRTLRRKFSKVNEPLIIYGKDQKASVEIASQLKALGYKNVRIISGGYIAFRNQFIQDVKVKKGKLSKNLARKKALYNYFKRIPDNLGKPNYFGNGTTKKVQMTTSDDGGVEGC